MPARRSSHPKTLSAGRPKTLTPSSRSAPHPSSKYSRTVIHRYHTLSKSHARALAEGDSKKAASLEVQLQAQGGIQAYQDASRAGQSLQRGGDTSRVLMDWLEGLSTEKCKKLRMLEVGSLQVDNACARSTMFDMTRIDLHSTTPGIQQQDFLQRPLPESESEKFDCVSLSLVVNYVPDAKVRGEMLKRAREFLARSPAHTSRTGRFEQKLFPALFLVLPAPCITHSRYLDEKRLAAIMSSIGFRLAKRKLSAKLVYYLWTLCTDEGEHEAFAKVEVNAGKQRNNFAIILE